MHITKVARIDSFSVGPHYCACADYLRRADLRGTCGIWLESLCLVMTQAQTDAMPVLGTWDMFPPAHPYHADVCYTCKRRMERKWDDLASSWTAGIEKIDLVSTTIYRQVRRKPSS